MKTWYIWGINLPKLEIKANSFDNAIAQARKIYLEKEIKP